MTTHAFLLIDCPRSESRGASSRGVFVNVQSEMDVESDLDLDAMRRSHSLRLVRELLLTQQFTRIFLGDSLATITKLELLEELGVLDRTVVIKSARFDNFVEEGYRIMGAKQFASPGELEGLIYMAIEH